jgi:hypothetical protein
MSGGLHESWNLGNHLSICLKTRGNEEKPVSRWPLSLSGRMQGNNERFQQMRYKSHIDAKYSDFDVCIWHLHRQGSL